MLRQFTSHTAHNRKQKHFGKRLVAGILVLLLILITMPSAIAVGEEESALPASDIPETLTAQQLASHGAIERLRAEEDEYTFVFLNQDGTRTSYSYGVPVKFEQNGEYIDKNNTIKDWGNEYGNTASDVEIRFPKHLNKISIKYKNHNIKINPVTSVSPGHINATVSGNAVTYYGAFGMGMDLRYASTMSGIKEDVILQSYQGVNSFSFEIDTGGLEVKEQNGQYVIADGDEVIFSFGDLEVLDSFTGENEQTDNWDEHRTYASGSIETVKANDKYIFTVTVDEDFLTSESTVYPVYIDPSFNVESTYIQDTYICEGAPNTSYTTNARMKVGYGSSSQRNRMLMQFSNYANGESRPGLDYTTVNSAVLYMNCVTTYTSQAYVDAYMIPLTASAWSVNTNATWNNQYNNTSSQAHLNGSAVVNGSGWFSFDITDAYTTWWQLFQSRGLMFRMRDEGSSPNYYREFASANHSDSTKLPYLAVNYGTDTYSLQVSPRECYLEVGQTQTINALSNLANDEILWSSSDPSVALIRNRVITAKAPGTAIITAKSMYNYDWYDTCEVTVVAQPVTGVTLNYETAYIAKGKQLTVTATVAPSNATVQDVVWSSSNSSIARVSTTGVITAVEPGTVTITVKSKQGNKTDTMTVIVPEFEDGEYYLENRSTGMYADIEGPTNDSGATIHQWFLHGYASQQWEFTLLTNGYYKIKSMHSNLYLSVENNSDAEHANIIQSEYTGASGQQWKLQQLSDDRFKLGAKSGEANNRVLALPNYTSDTVPAGIPMMQRTYVNDVDYIDEWDVSPYIANYTIKMYYDRAFSIRYGNGTDNSAKTILEGFEERVAEVFREEFNINITFLEPEYFMTLPERCILDQGFSLNSNTINEPCPASPHEGGDCKVKPWGSYCTSKIDIFEDFISVHPCGNNLISILFTGHTLNSSDGKVSNRSFRWTNGGIFIQDLIDSSAPNFSYVDQVMATLIHEVSHEFGAPDHYCEDHDNNPNTPCKFYHICSENGVNKRSKQCIMYELLINVQTCDTEDIFCPDCKADIMADIVN